MAKPDRSEVVLWILAGVGAGTLTGIGIALLLGRRAAPESDTPEKVDDLTRRARQVLGDLSQSVEGLADKTRRLQNSVAECLSQNGERQPVARE